MAECCKRQLNQGSFVLLYFRLFTFSDLISHDREDRLQNDLYCVELGVKLYSNSNSCILWYVDAELFLSVLIAVRFCCNASSL